MPWNATSVNSVCYLFLLARLNFFLIGYSTSLFATVFRFVSGDEEPGGMASLPNRPTAGPQLCPLAAPPEANDAKADPHIYNTSEGTVVEVVEAIRSLRQGAHGPTFPQITQLFLDFSSFSVCSVCHVGCPVV